MSKIKISGVMRICILIDVVTMICGNNQKTEIRKIAIRLKILNVRKYIVPVIWLSVVFVLKEFQFYCAAMPDRHLLSQRMPLGTH